MLISYLKTSWRSLVKNKSFSVINIAGLATGMAACIFILQYVSFELSYDHFNKNVSNLYRLVNDHYQDGKLVQHSTMTYSGMSRAIKEEFPEVQDYSRTEPYRVEVISYGEKKIGDQRAIGVDNSFLNMFSYPLLEGDAGTALKEPNSIVVSENLGSKLLSNSNDNVRSLIGQTVIFDRDSVPYKITGICKNVPLNSHLQFDLLMSYVSLYSGAGNNRWRIADYDFTQANFWHYILLKEGADHKKLEGKLTILSNKLFPRNKAAGAEDKFYLQPLSKAHLYSGFEYEIASNAGNIKTVMSLLIIALFILVIAWVNYINLTTAKSIERAKEVGIRKVIGATRVQLIKQFLSEAIIVNIIALIIALSLVSALQDSFNHLIQREVSITDLFVKGYAGNALVVGLILLIAGGIFLSGFYPAFVLSSYQPIKVLKGRFINSTRGILLRKGLVTGQFAITIALIIGSFVVYQQVKFMNRQPLGYNLEQMLVLRRPVLTSPDSTFMDKATHFIAELDRITHIQGASVSGRIPGDELGRDRNVYRTDVGAQNPITMSNMGVDNHFIDVYKLKLLSGRNFSVTDYNTDISSIHHTIINETAQKMLGFTSSDNAVGKSIMLFGRKWDIIGVVNDFHQKSLKYALEPTVLLPNLQGTYSLFSVKVDTKDLPTTIEHIKKAYADFFPGNLFDYYFLDEKFNRQYADDRLFGQVFGLFAGLAIAIACLGLFGLSFLAATQRRKEIGVRKVLGASVTSIVFILSKDFMKLVLTAFVIASPIAWYVMNNWLGDFAYRINISTWVFVGAGMLAMIIALATISLQAIKAATINPVKSLRTE